MTTILTKKKDTSGAPAPGDLTNAAGGAELAVNTADKRLYTKNSGGNVVEIGTNPTILNIDNIQIDGSTISSTNTNGDINITPNGTGSVVVSKLNVTGAMTFDGNVTVGNSSADTLVVNSTITSNLIFTDNTYDIGASGATRPRNLFLAGAATIEGNVTLNGGTANGVAYLNGSKVLTTGSALTFDGTTLKAAQGSSGATAASNGNTLVLENSAAVGMSLLSPDANASRIYFGTASNNRNAFIYSDYNAGAQTLIFGLGSGITAATEQMRLTSTGLGIGTTSPSTKLQVNFSSATAYSSGATGNGLLIYNTSTTNGQYVGITFQGEPTAGNAGIATIYGTTTSSGNMDLVFSTRGSSTLAERARITSTGNFAIGDTGASSKLFVRSDSSDTVFTDQANVASGSGIIIQNESSTTGSWAALTAVSRNNSSVLQYASMMSLASGSGYAPNIVFAVSDSATTSAERMRISSTGLVGIGTNNPQTALQVNAGAPTIRLEETTTGGSKRLEMGVTSAGVAFIGANQSAQDLTFQTVGSERMRVGPTGNVGIGTSSPARPLEVAAAVSIDTTGAPGKWTAGFRDLTATAAAGVGGSLLFQGLKSTAGSVGNFGAIAGLKENSTNGNEDGYLGFYTVPNSTGLITERARIDSSGRLLIGNTTPYDNATLSVTSASQVFSVIADGGTTGNRSRGGFVHPATKVFALNVDQADGVLAFYQNGNTERARFSSTGIFFVGVTSQQGGGSHCIQAGTGVNSLQMQNNSGTTPYGPYINFSAAAPNNASQYFIQCSDTAATRMLLYANGGLANYQANNVNLSDRREKTNFAPAKSYLDIICAIPVQTFNYIDQNLEEDDGLTLGVVAQDVQAVAPELVMESNWGTKDKPKMRLSIYQTDLQYALMKALQELKAEFDAYKASHP